MHFYVIFSIKKVLYFLYHKIFQQHSGYHTYRAYRCLSKQLRLFLKRAGKQKTRRLYDPMTKNFLLRLK